MEPRHRCFRREDHDHETSDRPPHQHGGEEHPVTRAGEFPADPAQPIERPDGRSVPRRSQHNLPPQPTPLVDRETELARTRRLLESPEVRLLSLVGPGGVGKTRLALALAASLVDTFEHGVWFVDLAPLRDPGLVLNATAAALNIPALGTGGGLAEHLADRHLLLVLDNLEQVIACAPALADLLTACPDLKIIATSREPLRLRWEHLYPVPPLPLPDLRHLPRAETLAEQPAVALFVQQARAIAPDFALTDENAPAVAELCVRLDGLPLAIELAATRSKVLSPRATLERLQQRLDLLESGAREVPARHRSLRAALDWSYDLLPPPEQALLRRASVFADGFTLESAEIVCADDPKRSTNGAPRSVASFGLRLVSVLDAIAALADRSLVRWEVLPGGEPRFSTLETVRAYARERLEASGERDEILRRHALYFLGLATEAEPWLRGPRQSAWLERLEREHANVRAALGWALDTGHIEAGLRAAAVLWRFWWLHGHAAEGQRWIERLLARGEQVPTSIQAKALNGLGALLARAGDFARAGDLLEQSLALARQGGDQLVTALASRHAGMMAYLRRDFPRANTLLEDAHRLFRGLGDHLGVALVLNDLGLVAREQGDHARAADLHRRSLALRRDQGHTVGIAESLVGLGAALSTQGDLDRAEMLYAEALALYRDLGALCEVAVCLEQLAHVAHRRGRAVRAGRLFGAAAALWETLGLPRTAAYPLHASPSLVAVPPTDVAVVQGAWAEGHALSLDAAVDYALGKTEPAPSAEQRPEPGAPSPEVHLTRREREVAALVARGYANRRIAETLVIAEGTAERHVANILAKLGFHSRAQLAAWAAEHGLLGDAEPRGTPPA